jgi:hypothetical protein
LCDFCGADRPGFAHPLDPAHVKFRLYGDGYTLPGFWASCVRCEALVAEQDDAALSALMAHQEEDGETRLAALAAFRAADLGSQTLQDG